MVLFCYWLRVFGLKIDIQNPQGYDNHNFGTKPIRSRECAYSIRLSLDRVRARGGKKGNFFVLFLTVILLHTLEFVDQTEQVVLFHFCVFLGSFAQISSVLSEQIKKHLARDLLPGCMHADPNFFNGFGFVFLKSVSYIFRPTEFKSPYFSLNSLIYQAKYKLPDIRQCAIIRAIPSRINKI